MDSVERARNGRAAEEVTSRGRPESAEEEHCGGDQEAAIRRVVDLIFEIHGTIRQLDGAYGRAGTAYGVH